MKTYPARPRLFVSKCLGFAACRWNGVAISDPFVESLKPHIECVTACPEVEVGLGVPRDPIRIVSRSGKKRLVQPASGKDVSAAMKSFAKRFLKSVGEIDGFILKDRSPSCGICNVRVYACLESSVSIARTDGFFGREVLARFGDLPVETEKRLSNRKIRERFLALIFASAMARASRSITDSGKGK